MKISTLVRSAAVFVMTVLCISSASAQSSPANSSGMSPDKQMGVGITGGNIVGANFVYAVNAGFHVGAGFGFAFGSKSSGDNSYSGNTFTFSPYAKIILAGMKDLKPFFFGGFGITNSKPATPGAKSSTDFGLAFGGGGEYFASRNVGIYGQLSVINLGFGDNGSTEIGLVSPQVGIEWFFNP